MNMAAHRTLDGNGRVLDGIGIKPKERFLTITGRLTTPYPTAKSIRAASLWLIENASLEARARGDEFNHLIFGSEAPMSSGELPSASRESMTLYLFEWHHSGSRET